MRPSPRWNGPRIGTYQGPFIRYRLDLGGQTMVAEASNRADRAVLEDRAEVAVAWRPDDSEILPD